MKILRWIIRHLEELVAGCALVVMVITTTANVISRYLFNAPIIWAEELATICLTWLTFMGSAVCYKAQAHLGMDFIINRLPQQHRRRWQQILCILLLCFFVFMIVLSLRFSIQATKTTPFFHLNYRYLYSSVTLGFLSMAVYTVIYFVMSFRDPKKYDQLFVNPDGTADAEVKKA